MFFIEHNVCSNVSSTKDLKIKIKDSPIYMDVLGVQCCLCMIIKVLQYIFIIINILLRDWSQNNGGRGGGEEVSGAEQRGSEPSVFQPLV